MSDFRNLMIDICKLQSDNAKAQAKHNKFQEQLAEQLAEQHEDVLKMEQDGIDHPFTKQLDDDYQERGLSRSDFIDKEYQS